MIAGCKLFAPRYYNIMQIVIATSIKHGKYKELLSYADQLKNLVLDASKKISKHYNLPEIIITIRPMREMYGTAHYIHRKGVKIYKVDISIKQDIQEFKNTLLHELTHIEQFYEGRMKSSTKVSCTKWNGKNINHKTSCIDEYVKLPWEVEAYSRADKLTKKIFKSS